MNKHYEKVIGYLAILIVIALAAWGVFGGTKTGEPNPPATGTSTGEPQPVSMSLSTYLKNPPLLTQAQTADWKTFSNSNFSVRYPKEFTVIQNFVNSTLGPGKERTGVAFMSPKNWQPGTNLSEVIISVEENPAAVVCEAKSFLDPQTFSGAQSTVTVNGVTYTVAEFGDAGAGNYYNETIVAIPGASCRGLRLLVHSTNVGNYDPGTITAFDSAKVFSAFEAFVASYQAH